jgi:hypothetical protein
MQNVALPYVVAALVGAVLFVMVGYFVYALPADAGGAASFSFWIENPVRYGAVWWALAGLFIGPAVRFSLR